MKKEKQQTKLKKQVLKLQLISSVKAPKTKVVTIKY